MAASFLFLSNLRLCHPFPYSNALLPPSSLGKIWDDCIHHCLHRNQSSRKNKNTNASKLPHTNTTLQITHAQAASLMFSLTLPSHRPVSSHILFSVCLLSGEAVWSQPLWPWSNVWRSSWRLSLPLSTWMDRQDVPAGSVGHRMPALLYPTIIQQITLCLQAPPTQSGAKQSNSAHRYILGPWRFLSIPPSCCLETTYQWAKIPFSLAFMRLYVLLAVALSSKESFDLTTILFMTEPSLFIRAHFACKVNVLTATPQHLCTYNTLKKATVPISFHNNVSFLFIKLEYYNILWLHHVA